MIKIHSAPERTVVHLLKNVLDNNKINCMLKNDNLLGLAGEVPYTKVWPELWIIEDSDEKRARTLINEILSNKPDENKIKWKCSECGEENEDQFSDCWNCGKSRFDNM